ncbi:MAG: N-acetylmuramoyl-L-alanine amidase [Clostridia bacterium]|nr:N-acetylmuramoyl-L-alanine amidase [Clostridia bacterium]
MSRFNKKRFTVITALILTVLTAVFCIGAINGQDVSSTQADNNIKVVIDAGHGGVDSGAIGNKLKIKESDINLKITKKLEKYLLSGGFIVSLTRSSSAGLYGVATKNRKRKDMEKRKEIINKIKPDMVISIHLNKYTSSNRHGGQVFYKNSDKLGKSLACSIQSNFNALSGKGYTALTGDYYILNCTDIPSVICECGFLSNEEEERLLATDEYQDKIAYSIFKGIIAYLYEESFRYL